MTVNLYASDGTLIATTTTAGGGLYLFDNLTPGDYYVEFIPPAGYVISPQDQGGNDATDSDVDPVSGRTITTTLVSGENDLTWDAGLYQTTSIGNFVWNDLDQDGIQDPSEAGIGGVTVNLYAGDGTFIAGTTTTAGGSYLFDNLDPGDYYVDFIPPSGYVISPRDQGGNDAVDSDADPTTGQTTPTSLAAGENDLTWDAGLYRQSSGGGGGGGSTPTRDPDPVTGGFLIPVTGFTPNVVSDMSDVPFVAYENTAITLDIPHC